MNPEDTYDCHKCHEGDGQVPSRAEHMYMHDEGGNLTCPQCGKALTENSSIRKHIGRIHAKQMCSCTDCPGNSAGWDQSSNHVMKSDEAFVLGKWT